MQTIAEIMTRDVVTVSPQDSISHAAELMEDMDIGSLPVCDGQRLVGMITDRDITVRGVAAGQTPDETLVEEIMTEDVLYCYGDQTVQEVLEDMGDLQIRRMPVLDSTTDELIGIVALGDLSIEHVDGVDEALRDISASPASAHPDRPAR